VAKMNFDPELYSLTIRKEKIDGEYLYVGRVAEFPNVSSFEETFDEARTVLIDAIKTLYEIACKEGSQFPAPRQDETEYSGRVTLRLTRSLHRQVAAQAESEGVSLNQFLTTAIAQHIGQVSMFSVMTGANTMPSSASSERKVFKVPLALLKEAATTGETNVRSR
jgi:predicted HicB family RNase H-like nuclease